jgi:hypothetical protein
MEFLLLLRTAVYNHGPGNFTTLSVVHGSDARLYYKYMYDLFAPKQNQTRQTNDSHALKDDKSTHRFDSTRNPKRQLNSWFCMSVTPILKELNEISFANHNITITSAIFSRPN